MNRADRRRAPAGADFPTWPGRKVSFSAAGQRVSISEPVDGTVSQPNHDVDSFRGKGERRMAILGLTHDARGTAVTRLPVTIKVAIGEKVTKDTGTANPARMSSFVFKGRSQTCQELSWLPAEDITSLFEANPRAIGIIFTSNDIDDVLKTESAWWSALGYRCHGKLVQIQDAGGVRFEMQAVRRTKRQPGGEPWPGKYRYSAGNLKGQPIPRCGENCPEFRDKKCKYSGDLYFRLEKYPVYGAICRIHTNSPRSITYLSSGLTQIYDQNGGRLAGVRAILRVTPQLTWYRDKDGVPHPTVIHVLSVEARGADIQLPAPNGANGFELRPGEPTIADGVVPEPCAAVETESDRAKEIAEEFYPDSGGSSEAEEECFAAPDDVGDEDAVQDKERQGRIRGLATRLGYTEGKLQMLLGQSGADLDTLERKIQDALRDAGGSEAAKDSGQGATARSTEERKVNDLEKIAATRATHTHNSPKQGSLYQ